MAEGNKVVRQREIDHNDDDQGGSNSIITPDGKRQKNQGNTSSGLKIANEMVAQLQGLLELQEKDLKEREAALEKRRQLLEKEFPQVGKDSDVLHLNVGGSTTISVLRRTLTHFEHSMLASRFSGRWDDSLAKDEDGRFFIDQDPKVFLLLVNYLRQYDQTSRRGNAIQAPRPTAEFCSMLEHYGLMSSVYPQEWQRVWGTRKGVVMTKESTTYGCSITISNSRSYKTFMLQVQKDCPNKPVNANSFTVVFEEGSIGDIGWMSCDKDDESNDDLSEDDGFDDKSNEDYDSEDDDPKDPGNDSFCFDLGDGKFKDSRKRQSNGPHSWSRKFPVTIICTRDAAANTYSIQVLEKDTDFMIIDTYCIKNQLFPYICFAGKVTISNVMYTF